MGMVRMVKGMILRSRDLQLLQIFGVLRVLFPPTSCCCCCCGEVREVSGMMVGKDRRMMMMVMVVAVVTLVERILCMLSPAAAGRDVLETILILREGI